MLSRYLLPACDSDILSGIPLHICLLPGTYILTVYPFIHSRRYRSAAASNLAENSAFGYIPSINGCCAATSINKPSDISVCSILSCAACSNCVQCANCSPPYTDSSFISVYLFPRIACSVSFDFHHSKPFPRKTYRCDIPHQNANASCTQFGAARLTTSRPDSICRPDDVPAGLGHFRPCPAFPSPRFRYAVRSAFIVSHQAMATAMASSRVG